MKDIEQKMTKKTSNGNTSAYLKNLQFNEGDHLNFLKKYVTNMRLVALVLLALVLGGTMAFINVPRTLNPEINIAMITVVTTMPGATPEDVETLVTEALEKEIVTVDDVKTVTSTSRESVSSIIVEFEDGVDRDDAQTNVQNAVSAITDLPSDASTPQVKAVDFEDIPIMQYAVVADDIDAASFNSFVESIVEDFEDQSLIDRVEVSGVEEQEVQVLITQEKMQELNVSMTYVASLINQSLSSYPAGQVYTDTTEIGLTIDRGSMSLDDLRGVMIDVDGVYYRLGDIADVSEKTAPGHIPAFVTSPKKGEDPAVTFSIYRIVGAKNSDVNTQINSVVDEYRERVNGAVSFVEVTNINEDINDSFSNLYRNLATTVILVFIVLFLFVGARQAFLAALSVPLVFMVAFIMMGVTGMTLNFLSIFSLLLALGLLVDVTIVIISAITTYYRSGRFTAREVGLLVWKDYFGTLLVTTLTTIWAFLPLLLSTGIIGEFIKPIPIVVSSMLIGSVFVGFFIILPLMVWLLDFSMPRRVKVFFNIIFFVVFFLIVRQVFANMDVFFPWYLWIIAIPTVIALIISLLVLLAEGWRLLKSFFERRCGHMHATFGKCTEDGLVDISRISQLYQNLLDKVLQRKGSRRIIVSMVVVFFFFAISMVGFGFVQNEFFPADDADIMYVSIELPLDTRAEVSEEVARNFVSQIVDNEGFKNIQTQIGAKITGDGETAVNVDPNNILFTINLLNEEERDHTSMVIAQKLRDSDVVRNFVDGEIVVSEQSGGPPAGADVTVKLFGDELDQLNDYANQIMTHLSTIDGTINVKKSVESGSGKVVFVPDHNQVLMHGLSIEEIGLYMRAFGSGVTVEEDIDFEDLSENRDIVIRLSGNVQTIDALERMNIMSGDGESIPLTTLGSFELEESPTEINREDQDRVLSVTAAVEEGYNANEINMAVARYINDEVVFEQGYGWKTGGANEENQKSVISILQAMVVAFILIFLTLIIQLNSYRKSFIVLLVIPLAISGVFILFAIFGIPLSFPALIGVLALFGIVINNSIMIIDQINKNHKENLPFHQAVVEGASSRLEPILLSSLTTIIGLTPVTLSEPMWTGLGGAIISGLMFSGLIMLFFIPSVYYMMMESDYKNEGK